MRLRTAIVAAALSGALTLAPAAIDAPPAAAIDPLGTVCGAAGWLSGLAGKTCGVLQHGDRLLKAGRKLLTGHVGGAAKALLGGGGSAAAGIGTKAAAVVGLAAVGAWVLGGARSALHDTATVLDKTTRPQLNTTWFSSTYWRMAGISALLTLPFLFAAAVQALIRSDLPLLIRAALGYLPLALLVVSVAAPLTMLLLAASDQVSAAVTAAAGGAGSRFLARLGIVSGGLSVLSRSPFVAFFIGLLVVGAAVLLWVEMVMREAAVYIVVLMLPLAFAALVWPARRGWAIRAVELLVALILSKFAIVSVLALGGAALGQRGTGGLGGMLVGLVLVVLAALAPWALVRLLPMTELASAAAGQLRGEGGRMGTFHGTVEGVAGGMGGWAESVTAGMRRQAADAAESGHAGEAGDTVDASDHALGAPRAPLDGPGTSGGGSHGGAPGADPAAADAADPGPSGADTSGAGPSEEGAAAGVRVATGDGPAEEPVDPFGRRARWETIYLGPEAYPPERVVPDHDDAPRGGGAEGTPSSGDGAAASEDHDPRPPAQPSDEGAL